MERAMLVPAVDRVNKWLGRNNIAASAPTRQGVPPDTFCRLCARFLRAPPHMLRLTFCLVLLIGCSNGDRDADAEGDAVPIGPGSDSTALLPPDTPMTREAEGVQRRSIDSLVTTTR